VRTEGTHFVVSGHDYTFLGTNLWYGAQLAQSGDATGRARLIRELDRLHGLGVDNLRILGGSEGPDSEPFRVIPALEPAPGEHDERVAEGLDFLLAEMKARGMRAVVCLNNFWFWSGGMAAYVAWLDHTTVPYWIVPGGRFSDYTHYAARFYEHAGARAAFLDHVAWLLTRTNIYTGRAYRDDPTIMSWELANEPRGVDRPAAMRAFIADAARRLKRLDPNHLVTTGSEGSTQNPRDAGLDFELDHASDDIDYATVHIWVQNWGLYDPKGGSDQLATATEWALAHLDQHVKRAQAMGKPLVLEEFGLARDGGSFDASAPTTARDAYYRALFAAVARHARSGGALRGASFWAWSGEGRPREAGGMWKPGDALLGDPPHEEQGWYGVYDADASTLALIRDLAHKISFPGAM
jgi:mannan endo-1,4-beta-mannosidase